MNAQQTTHDLGIAIKKGLSELPCLVLASLPPVAIVSAPGRQPVVRPPV